MLSELSDWIQKEIERRSLWAFMEQMGSERSRYHTGYLHALEDVLKFLEGGEHKDG